MRVLRLLNMLLWPLAYPAMALVFVYQKLISPLLPDTCRYHPSCSQYSLEAFRKHGFLFGCCLTTGRLFRCSPWGGFGLDRVPDRIGSWEDLFTQHRNAAAGGEDPTDEESHR